MLDQNVAFELSVAPDHPAFAGHFPGRPIVPGVVLLDWVVQTLAQKVGADPAHWRLSSAKFLSTVAPGEPLCVLCSPLASGRFSFEIVSGARKVACGKLSFSSLESENA